MMTWQVLHEMIKAVGFHNNKLKYIREATRRIAEEHGGCARRSLCGQARLPLLLPPLVPAVAAAAAATDAAAATAAAATAATAAAVDATSQRQRTGWCGTGACLTRWSRSSRCRAWGQRWR